MKTNTTMTKLSIRGVLKTLGVRTVGLGDVGCFVGNGEGVSVGGIVDIAVRLGDGL